MNAKDTQKVDWHEKARTAELRVCNLVEGDHKTGRGRLLKKLGPRDGKVLYEFANGTNGDAEAAVASARRSFEDRRWRDYSPARRREILQTWAALINKCAHELALLECLDVGKPISDSLAIDVPTAAANIRFSAEAAETICGDVYEAGRSSLSFELRRPIGVVAAIVGWNFPLVLAAGKVGAALAMGNSLVLKPSEITALSAGKLAQLGLEAGLPEGVLNVLHGDAQVGDALARHGDVNMVSFTGSTATGKKLLLASGHSNMKRLLLECGGKAANIVFDDAPDLDAVVSAVVAKAFWNQGQVCTASSRVLVHAGLIAEFGRALVKKLQGLAVGDPLNSDTRYGPLVSALHRERVAGYVDRAKQDGVRVLFEGSVSEPVAGGYYLGPTVFTDVNARAPIAQDEVFGPVLAISTFRDEEEAIRLANDTMYGLSAIAWTKDLGRAHRLTQGIDVGWMIVNATAEGHGGVSEGLLPVEGHKQSGIGSEGGLEGLRAYTSRTAAQWFV
jgi:acyl-CoA reductase-like NAD-dependent aldehyde dehydrogenase